LVPLERPEGLTQWTFEHAGGFHAVFFVDGELYVTDGACPHNGGPLVEGLVRDGFVTCPWHWYSYELATGQCRTVAGYELRRYPGRARRWQAVRCSSGAFGSAELVADPAGACCFRGF
jgi:nitrite reductase (NADH) small subunit